MPPDVIINGLHADLHRGMDAFQTARDFFRRLARLELSIYLLPKRSRLAWRIAPTALPSPIMSSLCAVRTVLTTAMTTASLEFVVNR